MYMHTYVRTYIHTYIHTNIHVLTYIHTYTHIHTYVLTCMYIKIQWEWLRSHADARSRQIDYLLDKIRQFNDQYSALRQFVDEGNKLLEEERPVGDTAARIQEQMDTCQVHSVY